VPTYHAKSISLPLQSKVFILCAFTMLLYIVATQQSERKLTNLQEIPLQSPILPVVSYKSCIRHDLETNIIPEVAITTTIRISAEQQRDIPIVTAWYPTENYTTLVAILLPKT